MCNLKPFLYQTVNMMTVFGTCSVFSTRGCRLGKCHSMGLPNKHKILVETVLKDSRCKYFQYPAKSCHPIMIWTWVGITTCRAWQRLLSLDVWHQVVSARSSSSSVLDHWIWPPHLPLKNKPAFLSHPKGGNKSFWKSYKKRLTLSCEALMSRRLLSHERLRGLVPHTHPLLPLSCPCATPSSPLAQDNYQPTLLPKRVIGARAIPRWALAARVRGRDPRDRPCRAATQENDWLLSKAWQMQVSIMEGKDSGKKTVLMMTAGWIFIWHYDSSHDTTTFCVQAIWGPSATLKGEIIYFDLD